MLQHAQGCLGFFRNTQKYIENLRNTQEGQECMEKPEVYLGVPRRAFGC